jgi:hypothetical protein
VDSPPRTFHWEDCASVLGELDPELEYDPSHRCFVSDALRVHPPLVFPVAADCPSLVRYLQVRPEVPGRHVVVLMQAGAVSLGLFEEGEAVETKSFKRYVVRGKGRSQPKHLDSKGKSRYGSRLRLQNARRLLEETNERLCEWRDEFGAADEVYYSGSNRLWADLFTVKPLPPFDKDDSPIRIPLDLPKPTTDVLLRTYKALSYGRIEEDGS